MTPTQQERRSNARKLMSGLFICYECRDGMCSNCIGIPCMCECPIPQPPPEEPEYSI